MMRPSVFSALILTAIFLGCTTQKSSDESFDNISADQIENLSEGGDFSESASASVDDSATSSAQAVEDPLTSETNQNPTAETQASDEGEINLDDDALFAEEPAATSPAPEPGNSENETAEVVSEPIPQEMSPVSEAPVLTPPPIAESQVDSETNKTSRIPIQITNIKYLSQKGAGTVAIEFSDVTQVQSRHNVKLQQFVIEVPNSKLPDYLKRPYPLNEFSGPFSLVTAYQKPNSKTSFIVLQMNGDYAPALQQEKNRILISVPDLSYSGSALASNKAQEEKSEKESTTNGEASLGKNQKDANASNVQKVIAPENRQPLAAQSLEDFLLGSQRFYGKPVSVQFENAEIAQAINFIAEESGANIVLSGEIRGQISMKLREVPWDQALVIILKSQRLGYMRQGNIIRIASLADLQREAQDSKTLIERVKFAQPMRVRVIPVSFARLDDLVNQIRPFLTPNRDGLQPGAASTDNRTNSLIVTDRDEVLDKVARLVRELDVPPAQVLIEGKIVEATNSFGESLGINWNFGGKATPISGGSTVNLTPSLSVSPSSGLGTASLGLNVGTLDFLGNLTARLGLAESESQARVLSSPRVVVINREAALIQQTTELLDPVVTVSNGGNQTSFTRVQLVTSLNVTPQVTNDGSVILDVRVNRDFAGGGSGESRPRNGRTAQTRLMVKSGQTAVLGGIYQQDETRGEQGVPGLKNVPIFGWLFKSKEYSKTKNELLIFITPRIMNLADQQVKEQSF